MTPAEMREAAALKALKAARDYAGLVEEDALRDLAAAIRALPLAETITPREKLAVVDGMMLAEERACTVRRIGRYRAGDMVLGEWWPLGGYWEALIGVNRIEKRETFEAARTWVLDTLRAEGWNVVEEGEGDG